MGVVFVPWHFAEAAANPLTIDALDPQAKIPEFKACAAQVFPRGEVNCRIQMRFYSGEDINNENSGFAENCEFFLAI